MPYDLRHQASDGKRYSARHASHGDPYRATNAAGHRGFLARRSLGRALELQDRSDDQVKRRAGASCLDGDANRDGSNDAA